MQGVKILIQGIVQGVGFRPFVYNLASRLDISGTVSNTSEGVIIHACGNDEGLNLFKAALKNEAPPLSRILSIEESPLYDPPDFDGFSILISSSSAGSSAIIPPDISLCDDCFNELSDPNDRRYQYPFINCTNCGPRFTIVNTIPYDRPKTSMHVFPMCKKCQKEYEDPGNRRFHAQPNACQVCGPSISWHDKDGKHINCDSIIEEAVSALSQDRVLGIRGLGGFHLVTNAFSFKAIQTLRERKGRPAKPLAIMVPDIATANKFASISKSEHDLLLSPEHPIVLLKKRSDLPFPKNLAPDVHDIGIMLPYTPLHHLLFLQNDCPIALVMTSGNISGVPICIDNNDAIARLSHFVDNFILHNREIVTRVDDSVAKVISNKTHIYRRARGYVPSPIVIPWKLPNIIACGSGLKSTFCLGREKTAFPSQHIGDLANMESYDFFIESINHLKQVFGVEPEIAACDLHPDYMSSRYGAELDLPLYKVQHHHAHAVSVMAENSIEEPTLAIILDGTGYGTDGTSWGGEILQAELTSFTRLAHLSHLALPGGDAAAKEPWRMALASLYSTFGKNGLMISNFPKTLSCLDENKCKAISSMLINKFNTPATSSCGRLFDAVASLLGVQHISTYEGQSAIELETRALKYAPSTWKDDLLKFTKHKSSTFNQNDHGKWEISSAEFVKVIIDSLGKEKPIGAIALDFHFQLIETFTTLTRQLADQTGINKVVLSGGCLQNSILLEGFTHALTKKGLEPFTAGNVPSNDGGISLGQAIIGGLSHVSSTPNEGNENRR